jgi:ketosteroid isomerase-like protein
MPDTVDIARRYLGAIEARDWDSWLTLISPEVVYELPQSRERIRGREGFLSFNTSYPGDWHLEEKLVLGDESRAVIWVAWRAGDDSGDAQMFLELDDAGRITRVTDFWPEPYDPPQRPAEVPVERW